MGSLIDRRGVKGTYDLSLIVYGLAGGSGLLIQSFPVLLMSRALLGIALAGIFTGINVLILNLFEREERDKIMGWRGSAQSVGGIIWPLAGGWLGGLSWHLPFAIYMIAIPIGITAMFAVPKAASKPQIDTKSDPSVSVGMLIRKVTVLPVILALAFSGSVLLYVIVIYLPQQLEIFGITSSFTISIFIAAITTSGAIISFFYGQIRKLFSYQSLVQIGISLWVISFAGLSLSPNPVMTGISAAFFGFSQGIILPTVMAWIGDIVPVTFRGRISSYLGTSGFIGQFLSPIIFAPVLIRGGLKAVFVAATLFAILWLVFILPFFRKHSK
jgi:MFS family permease